MRLTVAIVFCATLVAAGPQRLDDAHSHGVGAKRHTALVRSLAPLENTIAAHKARFNGNHDLRDVPDGLAYPGDSDYDPSLFGGYADDWITHRLLVRDGESDGTPADNTTVDTSTETGTETGTGTDTGLGTRASSRKWGIAWTNEITKGLAQLKCDQSIGIYNWGPQTFPDFGKYNCPFIPHLHSERKLDAWKKYVKRYYGKNYMMAPNEVNLASQANLTPERCAWMIRTYMLPLLQKTAGDGGYKLVGPSTANGQSALTWYDKFKKTDAEVWSKIYAVNLHFYGLSADDAIAWIKLWWTRYNKPIWLTEFACHSFTGKGSCNKAQAEAFMKKIIAFCNSTDYCHAYFLYGSYVTSRAGVSSSNAMFNSTNGALSTLGKLYVSS